MRALFGHLYVTAVVGVGNDTITDNDVPQWKEAGSWSVAVPGGGDMGELIRLWCD
jgi:hypothetical protein